MLHHTRGIVLRTINYSESSVITNIYTEKLGLRTYLVHGAKKAKAKIHQNILQPMHLLDMVVYDKDTGHLQRIKEAQHHPPLFDIPINIVKTSLSLFIAEVLFKVLKNQHSEAGLFEYLYESTRLLDSTKDSVANFHLVFLVQLSRHLGFLPTVSGKRYLDLMEGISTDLLPQHAHILAVPHVEQFMQLVHCELASSRAILLSAEDRKHLLQKILDMYRLHTENFGEIRSLNILEDLFADYRN